MHKCITGSMPYILENLDYMSYWGHQYKALDEIIGKPIDYIDENGNRTTIGIITYADPDEDRYLRWICDLYI